MWEWRTMLETNREVITECKYMNWLLHKTAQAYIVLKAACNFLKILCREPEENADPPLPSALWSLTVSFSLLLTRLDLSPHCMALSINILLGYLLTCLSVMRLLWQYICHTWSAVTCVFFPHLSLCTDNRASVHFLILSHPADSCQQKNNILCAYSGHLCTFNSFSTLVTDGYGVIVVTSCKVNNLVFYRDNKEWCWSHRKN